MMGNERMDFYYSTSELVNNLELNRSKTIEQKARLNKVCINGKYLPYTFSVPHGYPEQKTYEDYVFLGTADAKNIREGEIIDITNFDEHIAAFILDVKNKQV